MRIRTIKPDFFLHEDLFEAEKALGLPLRIAFIGLWCAADRAGRFKWEPRRLGVSILPYENVDFSRVLDALATRGFIVKYTSNGAYFGYIPTFGKHQVINNREKLSDLPEPAEILAPDASSTREPRVDDAGKAEGKGREGKGKEGKGTDASPAAARAADVEAGFEKFWQAYPRKDSRVEARRAFEKVDVEIGVLLKAIEWQRRQENWLKEGGRYIPYAASWLNQRRWEDEPRLHLPAIGITPARQAANDGRHYPGPQKANVVTIPDDV